MNSFPPWERSQGCRNSTIKLLTSRFILSTADCLRSFGEIWGHTVVTSSAHKFYLSHGCCRCDRKGYFYYINEAESFQQKLKITCNIVLSKVTYHNPFGWRFLFSYFSGKILEKYSEVNQDERTIHHGKKDCRIQGTSYLRGKERNNGWKIYSWC